jgi:hypothetical protein
MAKKANLAIHMIQSLERSRSYISSDLLENNDVDNLRSGGLIDEQRHCCDSIMGENGKV